MSAREVEFALVLFAEGDLGNYAARGQIFWIIVAELVDFARRHLDEVMGSLVHLIECICLWHIRMVRSMFVDKVDVIGFNGFVEDVVIGKGMALGVFFVRLCAYCGVRGEAG